MILCDVCNGTRQVNVRCDAAGNRLFDVCRACIRKPSIDYAFKKEYARQLSVAACGPRVFAPRCDLVRAAHEAGADAIGWASR